MHEQQGKGHIRIHLSDSEEARRAADTLIFAVPGCTVGIADASNELPAGMQPGECLVIIGDPENIGQLVAAGSIPHEAIIGISALPEQLDAARGLADQHGFTVLPRNGSPDDHTAMLAFIAGMAAIKKRAELRANIMVRRYEDLVHALPDIVYELDPDGEITFINESVAMLGYQPKELVGKHYSILLHEEDVASVDREQVLADYNGQHTGLAFSPKLFNERRSVERRTAELEVRLKKKPGTAQSQQDFIAEVISYGEVSAAGEYSRDGKNQFRGSVGIIRDMTLRRKSEAMLRKLYQAVDQLNACVFIVNYAFEIEYVNPSFFMLTGFSPADVIGRSIFRFFAIMADKVEAIRKQIQDGFGASEEVLVCKAKGGQFWTEFSMTPVRAPGGFVTHAIAIVEDISTRKSMEELLKSARLEAESANQAKSRFLASMTHELKSPIAGILAATRLMQDNAGDTSKRLDSIRTNAQALLDIMNGILDYVRADSDQAHIQHLSFPLKPFIESIVKPYRLKATDKGLDFSTNILATDTINGDPDRLGRAIGILLDNAVKFTESGSIEVIADIELQDGNIPHVKVIVKDSGVGIGTSDRDWIFQPFTQVGIIRGVEARGTGIGLALARNIIQAMGGEIRLDSNPGAGSIFTLITPSGTPLTAVAETAGLVQGKHYSILIVDDNEVNLEYMRTLIENSGYRVLTANGGAEAIRLLDEHYVDAAILDIMMPGYSGVDLARTIRSYSGTRYAPGMPLFAMTAHDSHEMDVSPGMFTEIFSKPTDIRKLTNSINEAIAARETISAAYFNASYTAKPSDRNSALAYLSISTENAIATLRQVLDGHNDSRIDVRGEAGKLATAFQRFACAVGMERTKLFIEHYPHEDKEVLKNLLERLANMLRRGLATAANGQTGH
jgi:PAS domain S-box-containing protein